MRSNNCDFSISRYQNCDIYIYLYIYVFAVGWTCSFLLVNSADSARFNPHFWLVLLTVGRVRLVARNSLQTHGYGFLKGSHRKKKTQLYHLSSVSLSVSKSRTAKNSQPSDKHSTVKTCGYLVSPVWSILALTMWCPPSYKLLYKPINYRYIMIYHDIS